MNERDKNKIYVVGHKNPDTDSICSAIAYAALKTKITGKFYEPRRAGQLNEETQYVLERFHVKTPRLLSDLREQIKDVELKAGIEYTYAPGHKGREAGRRHNDRRHRQDIHGSL